MILRDATLRAKLHHFVANVPDYSLINPASVDIRIGNTLRLEIGPANWQDVDLTQYTEREPFWFPPQSFALVATLEHLMVPNGYALELKLKSSRAREGYNHSLAFWFDPGWSGIGTMEISNVTRYTSLPLFPGLKFGQVIIHQLDGEAEIPYQGRYNYAANVEASKDRPAVTRWGRQT